VVKEDSVTAKQHVVTLSSGQRSELGRLITRTGASAYTQRRARILLHADTGPDGPRLTDVEIAAAVGCTPRSVARARSEYIDRGFCACLRPHQRADRRVRKLDGEAGLRLVELACSPTPHGEPTWTLRMLTARLIELEVVDSVCVETVRTALQKTPSNPG
jgi:hypothetical protein